MALVLLPGDERNIQYENRRLWTGIPSLVEIGMDQRAWRVGVLCHLALRHHAQSNGAGGTLKHGESTWNLRFLSQAVEEENETVHIITTMQAQEGYRVVHTLSHYPGEAGFEVKITFENHTGRSVTLDLLISFSMDNLSPWQTADTKPDSHVSIAPQQPWAATVRLYQKNTDY